MIVANIGTSKKISTATKRKIPRPFAFHWGGGQIVEEVSIKTGPEGESEEPTIQLLEYKDGSEQLRFCVYHKTRFSRIPLLLSREEIKALSKEVKGNSRIRELLQTLVK